FDEEVYNYFTDYVLNQPADRLMWGAGRVEGHENLFATIKSLLDKYEEETPDLTTEIAALKAAEQNQKQLLEDSVKSETESVAQLTAQLKNLIQ
ncbi:MAG TPA: peptidase, partial [Firmicutes bacterium]|nr:peptidase [Bacillota bacterium]